MATLRVSLDAPLPPSVRVGGGTALFVGGWCLSPDAPIRSLELMVDGEAQPVAAHGMPRLDVFRALHPGLDPFALPPGTDPASEDPLLQGYRSGFWGIARVAAAGEAVQISLRAGLEGGGEAKAELARIEVHDAPEPVPAAAREGATGPLVGVAMATFDPPQELFERQLDSIREQTHDNWVCVISDDCSSPERFAAIERAIEGDDRFVLSRSPRRLGFYANFERALSLVPEGAGYVALADQDDRWHPDKLEVLLGALGDARLVYSDARVVDTSGTVIQDSYWVARGNDHADLTSLMVANAVTGAASLFGRELLDDVLPFPPGQFAHFHDHWIGLTARSLGEIAFVDRPLYDYVQHGQASLGHAAANRMTSLRARAGGLRRDPRDRVRKWRMHYFVDVCRLAQFATVLEMRCGERMTADDRRALRRFTAPSSADVARLAARGARELLRRRPQTLGAEWMLFYALAWRRALGASASERPRKRLRLDAVPPPDLAPRPGRAVPDAEGPRTVADKIAPLTLAVSDDAPARVNVLIPTVDLEHLFGGYIAKFNLALRLAERGHRVRLVTTDPVGPLPGAWKQQVEGYAGLEGLFERVEVAFGREAAGLEASRSDRFVATAWWTAHVAHHAAKSTGSDGFLYLIQEYEPVTFPMGTWAALAEQSYTFPHRALYSTDLLRDWFRERDIGAHSEADSASFENAITAVEPPSAAELERRGGRRLLFYARPEEHAARNMFELGVLGLGHALETGALGGDWELNGIGSLGAQRTIDLGGRGTLRLQTRASQSGYARMLGEHDVGLALMYTPHPSLVPLEMASAGMSTVTNRFETKTPERLAEISPNLIAAEPTVEGVGEAIGRAVARAGDFEARAQGARMDWSRDWRQSFGDALLKRIEALLG